MNWLVLLIIIVAFSGRCFLFPPQAEADDVIGHLDQWQHRGAWRGLAPAEFRSFYSGFCSVGRDHGGGGCCCWFVCQQRGRLWGEEVAGSAGAKPEEPGELPPEAGGSFVPHQHLSGRAAAQQRLRRQRRRSPLQRHRTGPRLCGGGGEQHLRDLLRLCDLREHQPLRGDESGAPDGPADPRSALGHRL